MILVGNIYAGLINTSGMGLTTVNNGLNASSSTNAQLGGPLVVATNVSLNGNLLSVGALSFVGLRVQLATVPTGANDLTNKAYVDSVTSAGSWVVFGAVSSTTAILNAIPLNSNRGYTLSFGVTCVAVTGGSLVLTVSYTDSGGTLRTTNLLTVNALGTSLVSPVVLYPNATTALTLTATVTGTITCNVTASVL